MTTPRDASPESATFSRRRSFCVQIGSVAIGGDAPVCVQAMTDTDTANLEATYAQVMELAKAGSELVRVTVDRPESATQIAPLALRLEKAGVLVPLIGDFHYNGHQLLRDFPDCAQALAKYRINPGNVGFKDKRDAQFTQIVEQACKWNKPVRIGVNGGSLDQELLTRLMNANSQKETPLSARAVLREAILQSALLSAQRAEAIGLRPDQIVLSTKVSDVQEVVFLYEALAQRCSYALHLGLTEAGMGIKGLVASSAALAILLHKGIGDTIRISLTPEPEGARANEVRAAQELLQNMGFRAFLPQVTSCPGCGRTTSSFFRKLAARIEAHIQEKMPVWRVTYPGVETLKIAVMGCIVNGPGESKQADIGISLPGTGEAPAAPVFVEGKHVATLRGARIAEAFIQLIEDTIARKFS